MVVKPWRSEPYGVINNDVISYYSYLPAAFIYHDLTFQFTDSLPDDVKMKIWYLTDEDGKRFQKMSLGTSMMYLPFFMVGHAMASVLDSYPANGYSLPYQLMLCLSSMFFAFWGLILLRKILLQYFGRTATTLTLIAIGLGTNLFYYTTVEAPMTHAYNFFLFILVLYYTIKWHNKPALKYAALIGLGVGMAGVIRPTNILVGLVPLLYGMYDKKSIQDKWDLIKGHLWHVGMLAVVTFLCGVPLFLYWKYAMGTFLHYSYADEGFFFSNPKLYEGLFGFRKGWLVYTPLMTLSLVGWFFMKDLPKLKFAIPIFFILNYYVILSWWCWWYGGSFGLRTMIDSYGLLAVPIAALLQRFWESRRAIGAYGAILLIAAFTTLNVFQMWQYRKTIIHWDSMSEKAYKAVFLSTTFPEDYQSLINPPDYEKGKKDQEGFGIAPN